MKILDEHGQEGAAGKSEKFVCVPVPNTIMTGYLAMPEKSLEASGFMVAHRRSGVC